MMYSKHTLDVNDDTAYGDVANFLDIMFQQYEFNILKLKGLGKLKLSIEYNEYSLMFTKFKNLNCDITIDSLVISEGSSKGTTYFIDFHVDDIINPKYIHADVPNSLGLMYVKRIRALIKQFNSK